METSTNFTYSNWDASFVFTPKKTVFPTSRSDLIEIVKTEKKLRVIGSNHVWTKSAQTEGVLVNTEKMNKILGIDKQNFRVKVESGKQLGDLNDDLQKVGMSVPVLPSAQNVSVGGAVGNSIHGSNLSWGTFGSMVVALEVVMLDGTVKVLTRRNPLFAAFVPNLGSLGLVYAVTLQVEPLFLVEQKSVLLPFKEYLRKWKEFHNKTLALSQTLVNPYNLETIVALRRKKSAKGYEESGVGLTLRNIGAMIGGFVLLPMGLFLLRLIPNGVETLFKKALSSFVPDDLQVSHRILQADVATDYLEEELVISLSDLENAVKDTAQIIKKASKNGVYPITPIALRYTLPDQYTILSPAQGNDIAVWITVLWESRDPRVNEILKEWETVMVRKYKAKPHWGKRSTVNASDINKVYGKTVVDTLASETQSQVSTWKMARNKLDPQNRLQNDFTKRLLN